MRTYLYTLLYVGRRYARADEIGVPCCITIDFDSLKNEDCTIRDRDSTGQVRVSLVNLKGAVCRFLRGETLQSLGNAISSSLCS